MKKTLALTALLLSHISYLTSVVCAQNVGVDVASPVEKLDVLGAIRIGTTGNTNAGTIRYNSPNFEGYNGSAWVNFGGGTLTGSGTATRVAFWDGTSSLSSNANLYWNNTNSRLGIGTASPSAPLHVYQTGTFGGGWFQINNSGNSGDALNVSTNGSGSGISAYNNGFGRAGTFEINNSSSNRAVIYAATNGVGPTIHADQAGSAGNVLKLQTGSSSNTSPTLYSNSFGTGRAGEFRIDNSGSSSAALYASTSGTGPAIEAGGKLKSTTFQMTSSPTVNYVLRSDAAGNATWVDPNTLVTGSSDWKLTGNASTVDGTNFIGTTDNIPLTVKVNGQKSGRIDHLLFNAYWGYKAGSATTSGNYNTALGDQALSVNTTGQLNTAIGNSTLLSNLGGSNNIAIGGQSLYTNTSGFQNIAIGWQAMYFNVNGQDNMAMGWKALYSNVSGTQNTAIGNEALYSHTSGSYNAAFGYQALYYNKTGNNGVALGFRSQYYANSTTSGWDNSNTSIGYQSLMGSTTPAANTGNFNTAIGRNTLLANSSGGNNTALGYTAGDINTTGANNTYLGYNADASANNLSNATAVGANAVVSASNSLVLGNSANVGIGTSTPLAKLHLEGATELLRINSTADNSTLSRINVSGSPRFDLTSFAATGAQLTLYDGSGTYATRIGAAGPSYFRFGNVGIGTDTPAEKLDVIGKTKTTTFQMTTTPTVNYVLRSDATGNASWVDPNTLVTGGSGGTLDDAYDFGGAGLGRTITADAGAVEINGIDGFVAIGSITTGTIPATGPGTRMMWYPKKAAFRAGEVQGNEWDDVNIGEFSFASGISNKASGTSSFSAGSYNTASNDETTALGGGTTASGFRSTAMGEGTTASGVVSSTMGSNSLASGDYTLATGAFSIASGYISTAMGFGSKAESAYETAIGIYNTDYAPNNPSGWNADDRLFVIGNGLSLGNESDALVMLKNGNTGLGTSIPSATLDVVGSIKYTDGNEAAGKVLTSDAGGNATWQTPAGGAVRQVVVAQTSSVVVGSTSIPFDNTIPQITEGSEFITVTITPNSATSNLLIEVVASLSETSNHSDYLTGAIFRDAEANAIAAGFAGLSYANTNIGTANTFSNNPFVLKVLVPASSTSAQTFRFRAGGNGGAVVINRYGNTVYLGGSMVSMMTVTEIAN